MWESTLPLLAVLPGEGTSLCAGFPLYLSLPSGYSEPLSPQSGYCDAAACMCVSFLNCLEQMLLDGRSQQPSERNRLKQRKRGRGIEIKVLRGTISR